MRRDPADRSASTCSCPRHAPGSPAVLAPVVGPAQARSRATPVRRRTRHLDQPPRPQKRAVPVVPVPREQARQLVLRRRPLPQLHPAPAPPHRSTGSEVGRQASLSVPACEPGPTCATSTPPWPPLKAEGGRGHRPPLAAQASRLERLGQVRAGDSRAPRHHAVPPRPAPAPLRMPQPVPDNRHRNIRRRGSPGQAQVSAAGAPVAVVADESRGVRLGGRAPRPIRRPADRSSRTELGICIGRVSGNASLPIESAGEPGRGEGRPRADTPWTRHLPEPFHLIRPGGLRVEGVVRVRRGSAV